MLQVNEFPDRWNDWIMKTVKGGGGGGRVCVKVNMWRGHILKQIRG